MIYKIRPIISGCSVKERTTLLFAAQELQKYLSEVSDKEFPIIVTEEFNENERNVICLGVALCREIPQVEDKELDDAIYINIKNYAGIITGTNVRSVLIGVYRFLKELGFAFLKPGKDGEYYPDMLPEKSVFVCEKASYRHRAICIEGSVFQKSLTDTIDWLPKAAMNGYMMQFFVPQVFLERWYLEDTPYREKVELSEEDLNAVLALAEEEIEKRSLIYHGVGHGWTSLAFDRKISTWSEADEPDPKYHDILALVDGERKLWGGRPTNTNLCYSNSEARHRLTDCVVEYCKEHKNVFYLHFWLSDGSNNKCECDECKKLRLADWYVMMMNELDEKLTAAGIDTKIVFGVYVDTLWSPLQERFANNNRFLLLYCPISRSYSTPFVSDDKGEMQPYVVNKLQFPSKVADNLEYLKDWKRKFCCDSVDFDYHFMWDHYLDFPQYKHAQILSEDIKELNNIGLNGIINCKVQRTYLPSALGVNVMADTLWNKESQFEDIADHVLGIEFGASYKKVKEYLSTLSAYGCAKAFRCEETFATTEGISNLEHAICVIDNFNSTIAAELDTNDEKIAFAWKKLAFFGQLYKMVLELALKVAKVGEIGDTSHIHEFVLKNEMWLKNDFDAMYYLILIDGRIMRAFKNCNELDLGNIDG